MIKLNDANFFSFRDGSNVSTGELQKMIDDVTNKLMEGAPGDFNTQATGNTIVFGVKYNDEINIYVSQDYKEADIILNKRTGKWEPIDYMEDYLRNCSRSELINIILNSEYSPKKEV